MLLDCALWAFITLAAFAGLFLGTRRDLGVVLGFGSGWAATPWLLPPLTEALERLAFSPAPAALLAAMACLLVPGAVMGVVVLATLDRMPRSLSRPLPLGVEGILGGLLWGAGVAVAVVTLLGALVTREPAAYALSEKWHFPLRSSRLYVTTELHGLLAPPHAETVVENHAQPLVARRRPRVQADLTDPRIRAALEDPLIRRALESGDTRELEARSHLLRPLDAAVTSSPPGSTDVDAKRGQATLPTE